jgi:hypothetical protein
VDLLAVADGAAQDELAAGELDVGPAQRELLSPADAGVSGDADELGVLGVL